MAFVKVFGANNAASGTTIATASTAVGAGDTLVVGVACDTSGGVPTITVADGVNTFTPLGTVQNDATNNECLAIFVAENVTAGTRVITATYSVAHIGREIEVMEFSGRAAVSLDQGPGFHAGSATTATDNLTSAAVTTGFAGEDIACLMVVTSALGTYTAGTNYTKGETQSQMSSEYRENVAAGSQTGTWTLGTASAYICAIITLEGPSSPNIPLVYSPAKMRRRAY
jgi:hypothetical protein